MDIAIEDIINEAIVSDQNDSPVQIDLENVPGSDSLKKLIKAEFTKVKELLDFDRKCHEILRNWYVDGRVFYHKVIDINKPEDGLKEVRYIDPLKIKFVRKLKNKDKSLNSVIKRIGAETVETPQIDEYYLYDPQVGRSLKTILVLLVNHSKIKWRKSRLHPIQLPSAHSGLVDRNKQTVLSYLHKSIKALNQLRMIEDSLVIYRLSQPPERRIFYIDVGNLPKIKETEQYLRDVMNRYRNKLVYNASTGEIKDDRKHMSMFEISEPSS